MAVISVFYAAFGYMALLTAILWGMMFLGDGSDPALMDSRRIMAPLGGIAVDLGLLLLLALLHRMMARRRLRPAGRSRDLSRANQAWVTALALVLVYLCWRSVPHILWNVAGPLQWAASGLYYVAWTLVLIGAFLPARAAGRFSLHAGIVLASWTTSQMSVGHLMVALAVSMYLLIDLVPMARNAGAAKELDGALSLQGKRLAG